MVGPISGTIYNYLILGGRVARTYLNVKEVLCQHGGTVVDGLTLSVELSAEHFRRDGHLKDVTRELAVSVCVVDVCSSLEDL